jgi:tetratricopeptide (TPR) repeat protein
MFTFLRRFASFGRPDSPRALAAWNLERGRANEAEPLFTALLAEASDPRERAWLHNKRGVARARLQRRDEASADFRTALEAVAAYAPALTNLGNMYLESGDLDEAIAHYEAAIRADEEYPPAHHNLGVAYRRLGRIGDSVRELRKAQRLETRMFATKAIGSSRRRS